MKFWWMRNQRLQDEGVDGGGGFISSEVFQALPEGKRR